VSCFEFIILSCDNKVGSWLRKRYWHNIFYSKKNSGMWMLKMDILVNWKGDKEKKKFVLYTTYWVQHIEYQYKTTNPLEKY